MIGHAQRDGRQPGGHEIGHGPRAARKDDREAAGPEALGESMRDSGPMLDNVLRLIDVGEVNDERVERRPLFNFKDSRHGRWICCIGTEAVDRLGRESDESAGVNALCRLGHRVGVWRNDRGGR